MVLDLACAYPAFSEFMPTLRINGARVTLDCPPETPLLWAIRNVAGLTGTRPGCLVGLCGACTVHVDGSAVRSCGVAIAEAEGREVTTIEGVLHTPLGRALGLAWADGGLQSCEQCRPGRIMASAALLARSAEPSDDEVEAALGGHVCDCGEPGEAGEVLRQVARCAVGA
jgi:isoquinoline 1-oxidoreductase alpha subunit